MRCNWFTTARTGFQNTIRPCANRTPSEAQLHLILRRPHALQGLERTMSQKQHSSAFSNVAYAPAQLDAVKPTLFAYPMPDSPLTPAQMSRAACHAVRMSMQKPIGGVEDAYLIVNSLRYSSFPPVSSGQESQPVKDFELVAIKFGRPVSSRLASHALLHGLLRVGRKKDAFTLASLMMETGIRLRSKTLSAVISGFVSKSPPARRRPITLPRAFNFIPNHSISNLLPLAQNESTRLALQLLSLAGNTHQRRTHGMFATLITICLINGEIILASLLFGFAMNEYQLRQTLAVHFKPTPELEVQASTDLAEARSHYRHLRMEKLYPDQKSMRNILYNIDDIMARDYKSEEDQTPLRSALQALANLALLLDRRQIPFKAVGPLIRSLYRCPRTDEEVWIVDGYGRPQQVQAYSFFHDVLQRLMQSPPATVSRLDIPKGGPIQLLDPRYRKEMQPPLDLHAYNSLLHYSLRHLLAVEPANILLKHMTSERKPPLEPDMATYNILLRSATLLRRNEIARAAFQALQVKFGQPQTPLSTKSPVGPTRAPGYTTSSAVSSTPPVLNINTDIDLQPHQFFQRDAYRITTYIAYVTSTGEPRLVVNLLFDVFPELRVVPHQTKASLSPEERDAMLKSRRIQCLKRAVTYGPRLITAMLNALCKAGETGLAKCLWNLAQEAERKSWNPDFLPRIKPWCLPVHAYTSMLQCYLIETRKPVKNPRYTYLSEAQAMEKARMDGLVIYRRMRRRARQLRVAIDEAPRIDPRNIAVPLPDSRFFNAALALFAKPSRARRVRRRIAHYRHNLRQAQRLYARAGTVSNYWHSKLREVSKDMAKAGFAVPPSFRPVFVGRWQAGAWHMDPPKFLERRPLLYPPSSKALSPFSLLTTKDRGLPHRRRGVMRPSRVGKNNTPM
jgi:pentatricopeptide repeat protein